MNKATAEITRYNPSIDEGLSTRIVNQRIKENLVNKVKNKTYGIIKRTNKIRHN